MTPLPDRQQLDLMANDPSRLEAKCGHKTPQFGCRHCVAAARPTKINQAAAAEKPSVAFGELHQDKQKKLAWASWLKKMRELRRKQREAAAFNQAIQRRANTCGHVTLKFGCFHCEESKRWYDVAVQASVSGLPEKG